MTFKAGPSGFQRPSTPNFSRWDLFACVAGRPEGIALTRLAHILHVEKERSLIVPLGRLEEDKLITCTNDHYSIVNSKKSILLRETMSYAMAYGYDYTHYFSRDMAEFLKAAYRTDYFTDNDIPAAAIKPEILARLIHNGMLIIFSYKPLMGKLIVDDSFLWRLCEYLGIRRITPFFFRRKISVERLLRERVEAIKSGQDKQIAHAATLLGSKGLSSDGWGLTETSTIIKNSVQKEDTEMFDPESTACYNQAWERMHANVARQEPLSLKAIKSYHQLAMANTTFAGVFRDFEVFVPNNTNFKTAKPTEITRLLEDLIVTAGAWKPQDFLESLEFAAYIYNQFIYIHPFEDGNSRTARIIMAHILNLSQMPFEKIPSSFEERFLKVTKGLKKRSDEEVKLVLEEIFMSYLNKQELQMALAQEAQK